MNINNIKHFNSVNNISMVDGYNYSWEYSYDDRSDEKSLSMSIYDKEHRTVHFSFDVKTDILSIVPNAFCYESSDMIEFKCTLKDAEMLVKASLEANGTELPPLFEKRESNNLK
jgi:hypothetical protein